MSDKNEEIKKIELRSNEVQEILSRPPRRLIRYGTSVICGILALLIAGSFFFNFPDIISGDAVITTENPPVWVVARASGFIKELNCSDKQKVNAGDVLAIIENPASTEDIKRLSEIVNLTTINDSVIQIPMDSLQHNFVLGDIQADFSTFIDAHTEYRNFIQSNLIEQEKELINKQILSRKTFIANLKKQLENRQKEYKIVLSVYLREKKLFEQKVISDYDLEKAEQTYLNAQQEIQQLKTSLSQEDVVSSQLSASYDKLNVQYSKEKYHLVSSLKSAMEGLKSAIEQWQHNYVLVAPSSGSVTFNNVWKQNQHVGIGDKVFAIISDHPGEIIARVKVPVGGSGKVITGQKVNIKVVGYPYLEYGLIIGKIKNISLVPNDKNYMVEVSIDQNLITTNKKQLRFTGELAGTADIITENRSLIERIFSPIKYFFTFSQ
ncbi:MAG: HlyD family efflux transporter periplasmic adaptor subunit [Paludibacter sp.]|nr:HlyD family efflux transporter periplasmic adaptor subunit [Paludibacter sp.]